MFLVPDYLLHDPAATKISCETERFTVLCCGMIPRPCFVSWSLGTPLLLPEEFIHRYANTLVQYVRRILRIDIY